jgi:SNF2 family DNA or RNA helicase
VIKLDQQPAKNSNLNDKGWDTTDTDEINRRKLRGQQTEELLLQPLESHAYFGSFLVHSKQNATKYLVEIRSLDNYINSCECPDYRSNNLGTCKHIERTLFGLKIRSQKKFNRAALTGNSRIEIYLDRANNNAMRVMWPKLINQQSLIYQQIANFFDPAGNLIMELLAAYTQISLIAKTDPNQLELRVSKHMHDIIERERILLEKQVIKEQLLTAIAAGQYDLNILKTPLYSYQQQGMLHLALQERALLCDEMGLGKTVQAIAACELLHSLRGIKKILVVATTSLKAQWQEQISKFTSRSSIIIQGSRGARLKQYKENVFFYLTNYEQIVVDGPLIQHLLEPEVIILDEAQRIKNWKTKTANAVKKLKSRYAFVLTGTPLENRIDDLYSIVQFLDPQLFGALFRFNRDFYQLDQAGKAIGYKNLDQLHQRLQPIMLRRRKQDIASQLPERTVNNYFVAMEPEQRIRYEEYEMRISQLLAQIKCRDLNKEEYEKLQRYLACMRMICDTPFILDPACKISPKLQELENVLDELLVDPTVKIIIFSEWARMLELVRELALAKGLGLAWHTGSVSPEKRQQEVLKFKDSLNCRLFLSTDAGSVGLNLQVANIVINLDLPWNPARLEQRIARAWRANQTKTVQVINFVCDNSIEQRMLSLLAQKRNLVRGTLDGELDFKEMQLPSGRVAFIDQVTKLIVKDRPAVNDHQDLLLIKEALKLAKTTKPLVVAIEDYDQKLKDSQLVNAKKLHQLSLRKQRLVQVLIEQDFLEESLMPLKENLKYNVQIFACLNGEEYAIQELSESLLQQLIAIGLTAKTLLLFKELNKEIKDLPTTIPRLFGCCQEIGQQINDLLIKDLSSLCL